MVPHQEQAHGSTGEARRSFDDRRREMDPFEQVVLVARAVAVPTRLALLQVLGEGGCPLTTAASMVGVSPATAAHHLAVLMSAGLVTKTVKGRKSIYRWSRSRWQLVRIPPPAPAMTDVTGRDATR